MSASTEPVILSAAGLTKTYRSPRRLRRDPVEQARPAVDQASLQLTRGGTLGVIGESGSGKTTLARCISLLEPVDAGTVVFEGEDITGLRGKALRAHRRRIQTVFQDPYSSLDPSQTVGSAITEVLRVHHLGGVQGRAARLKELLDLVGLPQTAATRRPSDFSGGQRQRVCIARALAAEPSVLIADEAASALDVSIQAQILNLLLFLQTELQLSMIFISHDLQVVDYVADSMVVMFGGRIVERSESGSGMTDLVHPYSRALAASTPSLHRRSDTARVSDRESGDGGAARAVGSGALPASGCAFRLRCPRATEICVAQDPELTTVRAGHEVACHHPVTVNGTQFEGEPG